MKTKRIKTVFTLLLVLATALSCLTACGNSDVEKGGSPLTDYTIEEVLTNAVYDFDDVSPVFTD